MARVIGDAWSAILWGDDESAHGDDTWKAPIVREVKRLDGVALLWDSDYWDGPLSGLAAFDGSEYWFSAEWDADRDDWSVPRRYVLRPLTPDELRVEWARHRQFEQFVGTRFCHHVALDDRVQQPGELWHRFYDAYPAGEQSSYDDRPAIGWFFVSPY